MKQINMDISIPYYEDMSRISNSNVGWYMKRGPMYLRNMLDGKEEGLSAKIPRKRNNDSYVFTSTRRILVL